MARSQGVRLGLLTMANLFLPLALLVFASGFFPYKPVLPGLAVFDEDSRIAAEGDGGSSNVPAVFDRVVFMVVDALRSDFVYGYGSGFEFTQSLIRSGAAIPYTAHATPPTVTMPRIKALTTGSVPSFLDLILNFAESDTSSSLALQDTWLAQIKAKRGKLIFYGDDTWLKLFPGDFFERSDGTSSFFVSDFTEVDNNVTRHIPEELKHSDWNAMIMHYLGMDHIGHKTGPQGPNMLPKQREMDGLVKMIYEAIETEAHLEDTLFVLAGDHGMNAGGNHGGSGPGETEPALLFASPKLKDMRNKLAYECPTLAKPGTDYHFYSKMEQSDFVPSLAGLMGLPISRNSLGVIMPEFLGLWSEENAAQLLSQNVRQVMGIIEAAFTSCTATLATFESKVFQFLSSSQDEAAGLSFCDDQPEGEQELMCRYALINASNTLKKPELTGEAMLKFLYAAQETMSGTASSYNIPRMIFGMILTALTLGMAIASFPQLFPPLMSEMLFQVISILYGAMMFASSYVEEEQQFWYWITPAWILYLTFSRLFHATNWQEARSLLFIGATSLLLTRICVRWNQTGQKHAGEPDIAHVYFAEHHVQLWLLVMVTYITSGFGLAQQTLYGLMPQELASFLAMLAILPAILFKLNFTQADAPELVKGLGQKMRDATSVLDLVLQARICFAFLAIILVMTIVATFTARRMSVTTGYMTQGSSVQLCDRLQPLLTLFLMTQSRTPNIPLFLIFEIQRYLIARLLPDVSGSTPTHKQKDRISKVAVTATLFCHLSYFCMGGSNSISSIDLSNAYNGVAGYNIVAVGVLLFASNWAGAIWWMSAAALLLVPRAESAMRVQASSALGSNARAWVVEERAKLHADAVSASRKLVAPQGKETHNVEDHPWMYFLSAQTTFVAGALLSVMAACTALRTHLFIWTVFSPKYLYAAAWAAGWHVSVNIMLGNLVVSLASL